LASWARLEGPNAVTIGVFDGVHLGHRAILDRLRSSKLPTTVLTFDPHPAEVLAPGTNPRLLTTIDERVELLEKEGISTVGILDLSGIRHLDPEQFVMEVLIETLGVGRLVIGSDFHFGKDRAGNADYLKRAGEQHGFDVDVVDLVADSSEEVVTSSRIRGLVEDGDVSEASLLLGSGFRISNVVVHGENRGRVLGYPTANLRPPARKVIPGHGIYAARVLLEDEAHSAAVNVGVRPTFGAKELLIEAYLLDFEGDLYGRWLSVEFVERLRPEIDFPNAEALVEQINDDVARVRRILKSPVAT
jgi:riboflavin kinase/FMN adenylyltransferase